MYTLQHEQIEERIAELKDDRARIAICQQDTRDINDEISQLQTDLRR